jgi:hypothetical protein
MSVKSVFNIIKHFFDGGPIEMISHKSKDGEIINLNKNLTMLPLNTYDAKITFAKPTSNVTGSVIRIHIKIPTINKKEKLHVITEMSLNDFADGITGLAERPCKATIE